MDPIVQSFVRDRPRYAQLARILSDARVPGYVIMAALREAASWGLPTAVPGVGGRAPGDSQSSTSAKWDRAMTKAAANAGGGIGTRQ